MSASQESSRPSTLRKKEAGQGSSQPSSSSQSSQRTPNLTPSPAMLKAKNKFQEKFKRNNSASTSTGKGKSRKTEPKGKDCSSETGREGVDRRDPAKWVKRNKECDTKKGGRNSKTAYYLRNYNRVGSYVFQPGRLDRIYNADCSGEPYSQFVAENKQ